MDIGLYLLQHVYVYSNSKYSHASIIRLLQLKNWVIDKKHTKTHKSKTQKLLFLNIRNTNSEIIRV